MQSQASKSKLVVRKIVAPEPITASELDTAQRILARFVALAYVGDHPDLFAAGTEEQPISTVPSSSVVTSVAPNGLRDQGGTT
jgi:hypothetical protein